MHLSASTVAQQITMSLKNVSLTKALSEIKSQSGYDFVIYTGTPLKNAKPVTISVKDVALDKVLQQIFEEQPMSYQIQSKTIVIREKEIPRKTVIKESEAAFVEEQQQPIRGRVTNDKGEPLAGATIYVLDIDGKRSSNQAITNNDGDFQIINVSEGIRLEVVYMGYASQTVIVRTQMGTIELKPFASDLDEVEIVSTGYQKISKERATGSFSFINNDLINRSTSGNILNRLEGIAPSLQFIKKQNTAQEGSYDLRVRGLSTILSETEPLIVLDNFPYDGDINTINPNDVESITLLKDAAAASIWGARAGNGVIVITTKKGQYNSSTKVSFTTNQTVTERPDLFYSKNFLNSDELIDFQRQKFLAGVIRTNNWTLLPPVIELMLAEQNGAITTDELDNRLGELAKNDIRDDVSKYLMRIGYKQQYNISITGGSDKLRYSTSFGFDKNQSNFNGFDNARVTLNSNLSYQIAEKLEFTSGLYYINNKENNNGIYLNDLTPRDGGGLQTYLSLTDDDGNHLPIPYRNRQTYTESAETMGLLDWQFRPLDELSLLDNTARNNELRINSGLKYSFIPSLYLDLKYQFGQAKGENRTYNSEDSYYSRDLINRFTQSSGERIIPLGAILFGNHQNSESHFGRLQMNYEKLIGNKHSLNALAGFEIRENKTQIGPGYTIYGFDREILTSARNLDYGQSYSIRPRLTSTIPFSSNLMNILTDRFVSYYANVGYNFDNRITITGSSRWDASNIFGVRANQKGVPLWSLGTLWNIAREPFFTFSIIDDLRLRMTYGINGNVNKQVSAFPRIRYSTSGTTNLPYASLTSTGNPLLRWEQVAVFNTGIDFSIFRRRVSGNIEYYSKHGKDLIGYDFLDPTTGIYQTHTGLFPVDNRINYANILTKGLDIELTSENLIGNFKWNTTYLLSFTKNKVTKYNAAEAPTTASFFPAVNAGRAPVYEGESVDVLYSLPWFGLNATTGNQLVQVDNEFNENYATYWSSLNPEALLRSGYTIPTVFGSLRNVVSFKGISLSFSLTYKGGYNFRRASVNYSDLNNYTSGHTDYLYRWKNPGDEQHTNIPVISFVSNSTRDNIYKNNETLIEDGSHIRFQDVNLSYQFNNELVKRLRISSARVFLYANNLGIIWRANGAKIDPDYPNAMYKPARTISLGLKLDFN